MKENRQEIERTVKEVKITYIAIDGTEFTNEEECRKYEETAECVLLSKYRPLVIKSTTEYDVFGVGSDDSTLEIVKIAKPEDADILLQLYRFYNSHLEKPEYKTYIDAAAKRLSLALQGSGFVFVGRGCDDDCFWIIGSQESVMQVIKDACKPEEKKDDTEGENRDWHKGDKPSYCYVYTGVTWQHENSGEMMEEYYQYTLKKAKLH